MTRSLHSSIFWKRRLLVISFWSKFSLWVLWDPGLKSWKVVGSVFNQHFSNSKDSHRKNSNHHPKMFKKKPWKIVEKNSTTSNNGKCVEALVEKQKITEGNLQHHYKIHIVCIFGVTPHQIDGERCCHKREWNEKLGKIVSGKKGKIRIDIWVLIYFYNLSIYLSYII